MTESKTLPLRSQVPIEETWDLESIFPTPEDWEAAGEEITGYIPKLAAYQGKLNDPQTLLAYLRLAETAGILASKYQNYASN